MEFSLYCTCSLHFNVVKDISATPLEDNVKTGQKQITWCCGSGLGMVLVLPLFATALVVVVGSTGQDNCNYEVLLPGLGSNRNNPHLWAQQGCLWLQERLVWNQPDRKTFQGHQCWRVLQSAEAMAGFVPSKMHTAGMAWEIPHNLMLQFFSLIILEAEGKQLVWYRSTCTIEIESYLLTVGLVFARSCEAWGHVVI